MIVTIHTHAISKNNKGIINYVPIRYLLNYLDNHRLRYKLKYHYFDPRGEGVVLRMPKYTWYAMQFGPWRRLYIINKGY
jgi:hypothetical protein